MSRVFFLSFLIPCFSSPLFGSCSGERFTVTELLNHDPPEHHIFTCRILETYAVSIGFQSKAVVGEVFAGTPGDTVYISSGGGTTAGGQKLYPDDEWLIFSTTKDNLHYGATVCDFLSVKIKSDNRNDCGRGVTDLARIHSDVVRQYQILRKSAYSGYKKIKSGDRLIAEGRFRNGQAHGDWVHYSRARVFKEEIKKSEISYQNGMLHGNYRLFYEKEDENILIEARKYDRDLLVSIRDYSGYYTEHTPLNEGRKQSITTLTDATGTLIFHVQSLQEDYQSDRYEQLSFRHGAYLNRVARDSSDWQPLAQGQFLYGAKTGEWKYFNKAGNVIRTENYPVPESEEEFLRIYDEQGKLRVRGAYTEGKRTGVWRFYYDGNPDSEEIYDTAGNRIARTQFYYDGGYSLTLYKNNQKQVKTTFRKGGTTGSIENYAEGRRIFFNEDGTVAQEVHYKIGRGNTVCPTEGISVIKNGLRHGPVKYYDRNTGEIKSEGSYRYGYRIGVWTEYNADGSYEKHYYPTDTEVLMRQCLHSPPALSEEYDKDGKLLRTYERGF